MIDSYPIKALIFSKTAGYRHDSIDATINALRYMSTRTFAQGQTVMTIDATERDDALSDLNYLLRYDVLILAHTTGDFMDGDRLQNLKTFVRAGKGVMAIHAAASAMKQDKWYGDLIGARFQGHPEPSLGVLKLGSSPAAGAISPAAAATTAMVNASLPSHWTWFDEWYEFEKWPSGATVLCWVENTGAPLAWCHEFDGGRCFYTALGHFAEAYRDDNFRRHLWNGIMWAAGLASE